MLHARKQATGSEEADEVRSVVRQLLQAVQTRDRMMLDRILHKDYVYITDEGESYSREVCLGVLEHQTAFELLELEPIEVNVNGLEAHASYVATGDGMIDGRPSRGMFRIRQQMIRMNDKWQIRETRTRVIAPLY